MGLTCPGIILRLSTKEHALHKHNTKDKTSKLGPNGYTHEFMLTVKGPISDCFQIICLAKQKV